MTWQDRQAAMVQAIIKNYVVPKYDFSTAVLEMVKATSPTYVGLCLQITRNQLSYLSKPQAKSPRFEQAVRIAQLYKQLMPGDQFENRFPDWVI